MLLLQRKTERRTVTWLATYCKNNNDLPQLRTTIKARIAENIIDGTENARKTTIPIACGQALMYVALCNTGNKTCTTMSYMPIGKK